MAKNPPAGPSDPTPSRASEGTGRVPTGAPAQGVLSGDWDAESAAQTFEGSDLPPDVIKTLNAAWVGAFDPETPAGMTVKANWPEDLPSGVIGGVQDAGEDDLADIGATWDHAAGAPSRQTAEFPLTTESVGNISPAAMGQPVPAESASKPSRGESEPSRDDEDSIERTFISDEFAPAEPAAEEAKPGGQTWSPPGVDGEDSIERTFISDEFAPADAGALKTGAGAGEATQDSVSGPAAETPATPESDVSASDSSVQQTFISDEFTPPSTNESSGSGSDYSPGTTDGKSGPGLASSATFEKEDSVDRTFISDDFSPAPAETLDSGAGGAPARKTSPDARRVAAVAAPEAEETGLVIKQRNFRPADHPAAKDAEYELVGKLGEGGMGVVYTARQTSIDRSVAVKMLKPKSTKDEKQARQKFLAEAVVTGDLDHPNIVPIYDVGRTDEKALFYSMKQVQGTPWLQVLTTKSVHENLDVLMRVADAVAFAHARGVVHRDLKPENVMLGEFGEVLVMDWGLALPTEKFRKARSIVRTNSMGGTPAYMAPEMATGPLEKIGPWSDVYLLGAILYEIVTGKPPHRGKNAMKCLMSAAKNEIVPTEKTGELVDIALAAMATRPEDRYGSVQEFQAAIREYLSHSESITLAARADEDLERAGRTNSYTDYQQAVFGFSEAYELWSGNTRAKDGLTAAKLAYARSAFSKGDYDLAAGLLDRDDAEYAVVRRDIAAALKERESRQRRLKTAKWVGRGLTAAILLIVSGAAVWINAERGKAEDNYKLAEEQRGLAEEQRGLAEEQRGIAVTEAENARKAEEEAKRQEAEALKQKEAAEKNFLLAEEKRKEAEEAQKLALAAKMESDKQRAKAEENFKLAETRRKEAEEAQKDALKQKGIAEENANLAEEKRKEAEEAQKLALAAKMESDKQRAKAEENFKLAETRRKEAEEATKRAVAAAEKEAIAKKEAIASAYTAQVGLSNARVEENAFDAARQILETVAEANPEVKKNWEWARLMYLCSQTSVPFPADTRVEAVSVSPDGQRFVVGGWNGVAAIRSAADGKVLHELKHGDRVRIESVAFSPDNQTVATGSDDNLVRIWNAESGEQVGVLRGHQGRITSLAFSRSGDGQWLLTGSEDATAGVWDVKSGRAIQRLIGHYDPVLAVAFAPADKGADETRLLTADSFGNVVVWNRDGGSSQPWTDGTPFRGHSPNAVYAASFTPDGKYVASAGFDGRVLLWDPAKVGTDDFDNRRAEKSVKTPVVIEKSLEGHTAPVRSLQFANQPNARGRYLLATAGEDRTICLWEFNPRDPLPTVAPARTFRGHGSTITACAFDPSDDCAWILSGSYDEKVRKWNLREYEEVRQYLDRTVPGQLEGVLSVAFDSDGRNIITAGEDRTAKTWGIANFTKPDQVLRSGHEYMTTAARFTRSEEIGDLLVTAAGDNTTRVWDVTRHAEILRLDRTGTVVVLAVSPDGQWLVTGSERAGKEKHQALLAWNLPELLAAEAGAKDSGRRDVLPEPIRLRGHFASPTVATFSADGSRLASGDERGRVCVWTWTAAGPSTSPSIELKRHEKKIAAAAFLADGDLLTASADNTVVLWDPQSGREVRTLPHKGGVLALAARPESRQALTSDETGTIRLWDVDKGAVVRQFTTSDVTGPTWNAVDFSRDGRLALAADRRSGTVVQWNAEDGEQVRTVRESRSELTWSAIFDPRPINDADTVRFLAVGGSGARLWENDELLVRFSPSDEVASARFSPDNRYIATGSWDNSVRIWDAKSGREVTKLVRHTLPVNSSEFHPAGRQLLTASDDGTVVLWDIDWANKMAEPAWTFPPNGDRSGARMMQAVFSKDGTKIAVASSTGEAFVLDPRTGRPVVDGKLLTGHVGGVLCVAFSADGQRLLTGGEDMTARVWDLATGAQQMQLDGHAKDVTSVAFSPDGRRALTGSRDHTVKLWDTDPAAVVADEGPKQAKELMIVGRHDREVTSVAFSPNGQYALSGSKDGRAILWLARDPNGEAAALLVPAQVPATTVAR